MVEHLLVRDIENFLPTYRLKHTWKNRQTVTLEVPLFPTYLFARIPAEKRSSALGTPGVLGIIGAPHTIDAVPDHYIRALRAGVALRRIMPHPRPEVGDPVRIVSGPMAGVEGVLIESRSEFRVVLSIAMIRQSLSIEVSREEIERISTFSTSTFQLDTP